MPRSTSWAPWDKQHMTFDQWWLTVVLVRPPPFDDHVMMDGVPTSVHFDLTQYHVPCLIRGLVEVDEPSFHSPTLDSLSRAAWVIVDDGTPEEKRQREDTVVWWRYQRPDSSSWCVFRCTWAEPWWCSLIFWEYIIQSYLVICNLIQRHLKAGRGL